MLIKESFIIDHPDTSFDFLPTINITLLAIEAKKQLRNTQMKKLLCIVPIMIQIINLRGHIHKLKYVEHKPFGGNEVSVVESESSISLRE